MLSGPEVFKPIFLQFSPKTRLTKYDLSLAVNKGPSCQQQKDGTWWAFEFEGAAWNSLGKWK